MLVIDSHCVEKPVSSVVCGLSSVDGGTMPPVASIALPLDVTLLMICFLGAITNVEEAF